MTFGRSFAILCAVVVGGVAEAQILLSTTHTENFDSLRSAGSLTAAFNATIGTQTDIENLGSRWQGGKRAGTGTSATAFVADAGTGTAGTLYSYGVVNIAERALGSVGSGGAALAFGAVVQNAGSQAISSVTIRVKQENWRSSSSTLNTIVFGWGLIGGSVTSTNYLTATGATADTNLDLVGVISATGSAGALDGNVNFVNRNSTITFSAPLAVGDSFYIRWSDTDELGSDAGMGIDDFEIIATPVPEPASMAALGLGVAALIRRRRK